MAIDCCSSARALFSAGFGGGTHCAGEKGLQVGARRVLDAGRGVLIGARGVLGPRGGDPIAGHSVGGDVLIAGGDVAVDGGELAVAGDDVAIAGHDVAINGGDVWDSPRDLSIAEDEGEHAAGGVSIGEERDPTSSDHRGVIRGLASIAGRHISIAEQRSSIDDRHGWTANGVVEVGRRLLWKTGRDRWDGEGHRESAGGG